MYKYLFQILNIETGTFINSKFSHSAVQDTN